MSGRHRVGMSRAQTPLSLSIVVVCALCCALSPPRAASAQRRSTHPPAAHVATLTTPRAAPTSPPTSHAAKPTSGRTWADSTSALGPAPPPPMAGPMRSRPLVGAPVSQLRLPSHIPYWRLGLSGACAIAALSQQGSSEKFGWTALGTGLLTWALIDWFVPQLRSAAGS